MNGFIQNIISRQINPAVNTMPRLPGKFEPSNFNTGISTETFTAATNISQQKNVNPVNTENNNNIVQHKNMDTFTTAPTILSTETIAQHIHTPERPGINYIQKNNIPVENISPLALSMNLKNFNNNIPDKIKIEEDNAFSKHKQPGDPDVDDIKKNIPLNESMPGIEALKEILSGKNELKKRDAVPVAASKYGTQNPNMPAGHLLSEVYTPPATPVIKISIGRIEVRAVSPASPIKVTREAIQKPKMSLDEYLKKRNNR